MTLVRGIWPKNKVLAALEQYREATTYDGTPQKHGALNEENVAFCVEILNIIFEEFLGSAPLELKTG